MSPVRGSVRRAARVGCPAADIWQLVGDPARLREWWPGIAAVTMDGDVRTVTTDSGMTIPERILTLDPLQRRFQYAITLPLLHEHLSTLDVHELGPSESLVVYAVDAVPAMMALLIGSAGGAAIGGLPALLERHR